MHNLAHLSIEDRAKLFDLIYENTFSYELNMNDTFGWACAESEVMTIYDLSILAPVLLKYGHRAFIAFAAYKKKAQPISCSCDHKESGYVESLEEIKILAEWDAFFPDPDGAE